MRRFTCAQCNAEIFFDSLICETCHSALIFDPLANAFLAAAPAEGAPARACTNREAIGCNWASEEEAGGLCRSCTLTTKVPDLGAPNHVERWAKLETAKRLVVNALDQLRLSHPTKRTEPESGLAFQFLADDPAAPGPSSKVLTGHEEGTIVINIAEADDAIREQRRTAMKEPYRTLVGHIRHELGHYYWDRLIRDGGDIKAFRAVFGDEREDYAQALERHYHDGPARNWREDFVSAYASSHPWEDFAETWAHYLHTVDGLETAVAFGLASRPPGAGRMDGGSFPYLTSLSFERIAAIWGEVTIAVNAMNRSMGQPDLYPFVLSNKAIAKVAFVHELIVSRAEQQRAAA
jgi:hypothetical protein